MPLRSKQTKEEFHELVRGVERVLAKHPTVEEATQLLMSFRLYVSQDIIPLKPKAKQAYLKRINRLLDRWLDMEDIT